MSTASTEVDPDILVTNMSGLFFSFSNKMEFVSQFHYWLPPCGQVQLSILIKASGLRDKLPLTCTQCHYYYDYDYFALVYSSLPAKDIQEAVQTVAFTRLSRLTVSSRGNERGLMAAARPSGIPLT